MNDQTMKAIRIESPGKMRLICTAIPVPPPDFVRIKVKAAAICATDLEVIDNRIPASHNHHFKWWFGKTPPRAMILLA